MIVLDASVGAELALRTVTGARAAARLGRAADTLHAPHLIDLEVASVLRRLEAIGSIDRLGARVALDELLAIDLQRYAHDLLLPRIWQLRGNLTCYDAAYVALAEALGAPLLTCDARLAAAPGHAATVEVV